MQFRSISPKRHELKKYIQYILFNYSDNPSHKSSFTSFPNNNISLCIVKGKQVIKKNELNSYQEKATITSYLTGLYLQPNSFEVEGVLDEICIEFTVAGYYRFFPFPVKQFMLNDDIINEAFGKNTFYFFEKIFEESDFNTRCNHIEDFLLSVLTKRNNVSFIEQVVSGIDAYKLTDVNDITGYFNCSYKKLYRAFKTYYDVSPKEYLQLLRFRKSLLEINTHPDKNLTEISYDCGYYDQSHFIKDFRQFAKTSPKMLQKEIQDVDGNVLITVN
ncbi:helix-turn-helix domain-containing protein [Flavobacteriaceae bacterium R38]|nr:helix-turn-helix domain-containing protein [Flavobacteriaceae bacterium R38]